MKTCESLLLTAGCFSILSVCISLYLIRKHQKNMTNFKVQSKIIAIIWMVPIYSVDSFLSLFLQSVSLYIDMLRDCYEAYVLYLFLSLMLSYLNCDGEEGIEGEGEESVDYYNLVSYLESKQPAPQLPFPFSLFYQAELPKGRDFLIFCKFGTLQYCVIRPLTTLVAIILDQLNLYHESNFSPQYGWFYLTIAVNISIAFAFAALATFYITLKKKLAPYKPVGKFLCIKFVIFFAFWQSVIIAILVRFGFIHSVDGYTAHTLAHGLQDMLICIEMFLVSIAHLYTFSYRPFTEEENNEEKNEALLLALAVEEEGYVKSGRGSSKDGSDDMKESMRHSYTPSSSLLGPLLSVSTVETHISSSPSRNSKNKKDSKVSVSHELHASSTPKGSQLNYFNQIQTSTKSIKPSNKNKEKEKEKRKIHNKPLIVTKVTTPTTAMNGSINSLIDNTNNNHTNNKTSNKSKNMILKNDSTNKSTNNSTNILNSNFASSGAIRDFNKAMPVIVLPSNFTPEKGMVMTSRPGDRVKEGEEEG